MPTYEYRCEGPVEVVLHPVAVHFKGSGFYSTDYGRGGKRKGEASRDGDSGSSEKTEKKEPPAEKKAAEA